MRPNRWRSNVPRSYFPGAEHANVQPHSGSQANMAAYFAVLEPGDRVMGMSLDHGGHLTHGSPVNFSGRIYDFVHYGLDEASEMIDYDAVERMANELMPKIIVSGYSAYSRTIDFERFGKIADSIGAIHLADMAHIAGLIAAHAHPSPVPHAAIVTSTTHKTLRGPRGAMALTTKEWARKYDSAVFPRMQGGPMGHTIAAKAVAYKEALSEDFKQYARNIVSNAAALAEALTASGMRIVSGGTDNHLMLVDMRGVGVTGAEAETKMRSVGIVANKNMVPFDPNPPRVTSGVRVGVPAVTSRGMAQSDMETVAELIVESLRVDEGSGQQCSLSERVKKFASSFPVPRHRFIDLQDETRTTHTSRTMMYRREKRNASGHTGTRNNQIMNRMHGTGERGRLGIVRPLRKVAFGIFASFLAISILACEGTTIKETVVVEPAGHGRSQERRDGGGGKSGRSARHR